MKIIPYLLTRGGWEEVLKRQSSKLFANFFSLNKTNIQAPDKQARTVIQIPLSGLIFNISDSELDFELSDRR